MNSVSCSIIIHNDSRSDILTNVADLAIYGISIYNDIREITEDDLKTSNRIVILGSIPVSSVSDLRLYSTTLDLDMYYVNSDKLLTSIMSEFCKTFALDYTRVDQSMLLSIFYNDITVMEQHKVTSFNESISVESAAKRLVDVNDKSVANLAEGYLLLREFLDDKVEIEKVLKEKINDLESNLLGLYSTNESLMQEITQLIVQYNSHYESLKDYKVMFTEDIYETVSLSNYKNAPKVIYFKEYSEFLHLESFIETLKDMFNLQLSSSVKIIRLHDSHDVNRIKLLSDDYLCVNGKFMNSEVTNNDYILSYGNYLKLLDNVFTSPIDYVVIIDCKKFNNIVLTGDFLKLNLCRSFSSLDKLNLADYNTLVNNHDCILSWDTYDRYKEFINEEDRFVYLSSRPVFKKMYQLICDIV